MDDDLLHRRRVGNGMKKQKLILYDGKKSSDLWDSDRGWTVYGSDQDTGIDLLVKSIPWLYRAIKIRANSVQHVPFAITRNGKDYDTSADWQNKVNFMPNPRLLLRQFTRSLIISGAAYADKGINRADLTTRLVYLSPKTITPIIDPQLGLTGFERTNGVSKRTYQTKEILSIYDPDYDTEAGPSSQSDAIAALQAAGVLYYLDVFVQRYFERGAIRATVLSVDGTSQQEAGRLKEWWNDVITGVRNAWSAFVLKGKEVTPTMIGDGIEGLQDNDLTESKRQDIATALGIPESKMWSAAANYATSKQDNIAYYEETVLPDCELIASALNDQVFRALGLSFEFRPESMTQFQEEKVSRASAYAQYISSGMLPSLAAQIVGIDLPQGIEYTDLDAVDEPEPTPPAETQPVVVEDIAPAQRSALDNWRKKSLHALKLGKSANCEFITTLFGADEINQVRGELAKAVTPDDVKRIFADAKKLVRDKDDQLKRANDLLERALE